jgi:circadian clock protein KaiB
MPNRELTSPAAAVAGDTPPRSAPHYELRLYIAGNLPNSVQAEQNLRALAEEYLAGRHTLEVVDFLEEPQRALADGVLVTPTLLKLAPAPRQMVVGTLADRPMLLRCLGLREGA